MIYFIDEKAEIQEMSKPPIENDYTEIEPKPPSGKLPKLRASTHCHNTCTCIYNLSIQEQQGPGTSSLASLFGLNCIHDTDS